MKFPKHISVDIRNNSLTNVPAYWAFTYCATYAATPAIFEEIFFFKKFLNQQKKFKLTGLLTAKKKFTITHHTLNFIDYDSTIDFKFFDKPFLTNKNNPTGLPFVKYNQKLYQANLAIFNKNILNSSLKNFEKLHFIKKTNKTMLLWSLFDINFLKKEKIYTKLKYSRVPQYDIVSGGVAALFSGFLGFLICERFGFELLDSADFYYLFMYCVFLFFFLKPLFRISNGEDSAYTSVSFKWFLFFYFSLFSLLIRFGKRTFLTFKSYFFL